MCIFYSVQSQNLISQDIYVSNQVDNRLFPYSNFCKLYGATKIIVNYENEEDWTYDMRGAFEYACKIWEETMPTSYPIRIKAKIDNQRQTESFSNISFQTLNHGLEDFYCNPFSNTSTWTQIKGATFNAGDEYIYQDLLSPEMFTTPDIILTYYNKDNKLMNNCKFSVDDIPDSRYYDFVTMVLRDLAKAFGLVWRYSNVQNGMLHIDNNNIIPFEKKILESLGYYSNYNAQDAYQQALQGPINIDDWLVYSPAVWDPTLSLNYFVSDGSNNLASLLRAEFGKGCVIRDIKSDNTYNLFSSILHWCGDIVTGLRSVDSATPTPIKAYAGPFTNFDTANASAPLNISSDMEAADILDALRIFSPHLRMTNNSGIDGITVSLLLKTGEWDVVFDVVDSYGSEPDDPSLSQFRLHHQIEEYARSCNGYFISRFRKAYFNYAMQESIVYKFIDYLPQQVELKKTNRVNRHSYYYDTDICIKNLEGVTRIVVSQQDGDEALPYSYEITNFKDGKFEVTLDTEYTTELRVTSYNHNGHVTSLPYIIPPLRSISDFNYSLENVGSLRLKVSVDSHRYSASELICSINVKKVNANGVLTVAPVTIISGDTIDISRLSSGTYSVNIIDIEGNNHMVTFIKR